MSIWLIEILCIILVVFTRIIKSQNYIRLLILKQFGSLEHAIKKLGDKEIQWSRLGMLRLSPEAMRRLFIPTMEKIKQAIGDVLNNRGTRGRISRF